MKAVKLIFLLTLSLVLVEIQAQETKDHYFYGGVFDVLTRQIVDSVTVDLLDIDGNVSRSMTTKKDVIVGYDNATWYFYCNQHTQKQRARFSAKGYESKEVDIPALHFSKREFSRQLFNVYLHRSREQQLGEATIVATKIKFYHRGDTLIYNADAFQLGEGSMLDVLIRQLPGTTLKKDGRIFVNGRQVESLLLNGEDFFGKDGGILLNNLPAYMVKQVQVFEKQGKLNERVGKDVEKREFVMDVRLKKQYNIGWVGQILAGLGTNERYLSRLFALRFTPQSRLSFYGNANNLSTLRQPGQDDGWTPDDMDDNRITTQQVGIDLLVNGRDGRFSVNSNTKVEHQLTNGLEIISQELFLPQGNSFKQSWNNSHTNRLSFSSENRLELHPYKQTWYNVSYNLSYGKRHQNSAGTNATFLEKPNNSFSYKLRDSLRLQSLPEYIRKNTLNRNYQENIGSNRDFATSGQVTMQKRVFSNDMIYLSGSISYAQAKGKTFETLLTDMPYSYLLNTDFRNRYANHSPNRTTNFNFTTFYFYWLNNNVVLIPHYSIDAQTSRSRYALYNLHKLPGYAYPTYPTLGTIPNDDFSNTIDTQNSYCLKEHTLLQTFKVSTKWQTISWFAQLELPLKITNKHLTYAKGSFDNTFTKNYCFFEPTLDIFYKWGEQIKRKLEFKYVWQHNLPLMTDYVEEINNANPLVHYIGNVSIKNSDEHSLEFTYEKNNETTKRSIRTGLQVLFSPTDISDITSFDYTSGITLYQKGNTHGSYWLCHTLSYTSPISSPNSPWSFQNDWLLQYVHGVDLAQQNKKNIRSIVRTTWLTNNASLDYTKGEWHFSLNLGGEWNSAISKQQNFSTINIGNLKYGLSLTIPKIYGIQLSTDFFVYNRFGYTQSLKKPEYIWNARLSRSFGENWLVYFDGFDLLHQLSGISQTINSQGRTETVRYPISRYGMFHLVHKFNPSRRKK